MEKVENIEEAKKIIPNKRNSNIIYVLLKKAVSIYNRIIIIRVDPKLPKNISV